MKKGEIEKTEVRYCEVCKRETEQLKDGRRWVCTQCLLDPQNDFEKVKKCKK